MLEVTLLGCGATMPLPDRALAVCAVKYQGHIALLDCGEGTQAAARRAGVSLVRIDMICLTHYHGDHIFGLPGLLQTMASQGRTELVRLLGPKTGYADTIELLLTLAGPLPFAVERCPVDMDGESFPLWENMTVKAFPLNHRVPCVGYRFSLPRAGRFQPEKARALGVPCCQWGMLQKGEPVKIDSGEIVYPQQVIGAARTGLTVVYALDTAPCAALTENAEKADLLICDATYGEDTQEDKAELYGHSTFSQDGKLAAQAGVKRLWLTHFGGALTDPHQDLYRAQQYYPGAEAGFDGKREILAFPEEE